MGNLKRHPANITGKIMKNCYLSSMLIEFETREGAVYKITLFKDSRNYLQMVASIISQEFFNT